MITPEILSYIATEQGRGTAPEIIRSNLLANGWSENDINEAISSIPASSATNKSEVKEIYDDLRKHRNKRKWIIFGILILIDFIIIMIMGGQGLFGISPISIVVRVLVIYGIASFSTVGSSPKQSKTMTVFDSIARTLAAFFLFVGISIGVLFLFCLFALGGFGR